MGSIRSSRRLGDLENQYGLLALEERRIGLEYRKLALEEKRVQLGLNPGKDGGSNKEGSIGGSFDSKLPKGVVPKYTEGDDIDKWFTSFERACKMRKLGKQF